MVPMMVSADGSTSYGGAAPQTMPMMGNPFMMSQPYMMPQVPQAQPPNTSGMPQQLNQQQQHHQPVMLQQPQHNPFSGYAMAPQQQQQQQQHQPQQSSQDNSTTNAVPAPAPVPVQPQHPTGMQFMQNNMTSHMGMPGNFVMGPNGMMMMMAPLQNGAPNNQYQTTAAPMMISTPAPADNNTSSTGNVDAFLGNATVATTGRDGNGSSNSSTDSKTPASGGQGTTGSNLAHCA